MTERDRPDPDRLLAEMTAASALQRRGRLKIFFGASAGVGKTYAMLVAAQTLRASGVDVVVGLVETHGRRETETLVAGLDRLPTLALDVQGTQVLEFDLDAALARRPSVMLVDELAHTNAPGARHPKRWQDVEELLAAGIDVYTTLNVQHLESLNDVVSQITGVRVNETLPDTFFETADEVELIDLPPDELLDRLRGGKVYGAPQIERALANFFKKGNLIALREMALRQTADRVDAQMREYRDEKAIAPIWAAGDRIVVAIGPDTRGEQLVRAGKRVADAIGAQWQAVYVETPSLLRLAQVERNRILGYLRLAEQLGAETAVVSGSSVADELLAFARAQNATRIIMGRATRTGATRWLLGSVIDSITAGLRGIDVQLVGDTDRAVFATAGVADQLAKTKAYFGLDESKSASRKPRWPGYAAAVVICGVATACALLLHGRMEATNLVMVYLVGVMVAAYRFGRGPAIVASLLSVALFDFIFVPPFYSFAVTDTQYLLTFAVMLLVSLIISGLTANIRLQAKVAQHRQVRTEALYTMTRELARAGTLDGVVSIGVQHVSRVFESQAVVLMADGAGIAYPAAPGVYGSFHGADLGIARWVFGNRVAAGLGTDTLSGSDALYLPLAAAHKLVGVLAVLPSAPDRLGAPEQRHLLETFAAQLAAAIERVQLAADTVSLARRADTESLRNSLLNAISHDLRTPLAVLVGASSSLVEDQGKLSDAARAELAATIHDESRRMTVLVNNLLDMARLESGKAVLARQWTSLEELIGSVLTRLAEALRGRPVNVAMPAAMPLLSVDAVLIEQVLANLLENAAKYTPAQSPIDVSALLLAGRVAIEIADRGPGIPAGEEARVFDKFHRVHAESAQSGVGLGLAIAKAIVAAHGGSLTAANRHGGGAVFRVELPAEPPPPMEEEADSSTMAAAS